MNHFSITKVDINSVIDRNIASNLFDRKIMKKYFSSLFYMCTFEELQYLFMACQETVLSKVGVDY